MLHLTEEEVKEEVVYVRALFVFVHCRYQASRDDLSVFAALRQPVPAEFVNLSRWHSHIAAPARSSFRPCIIAVPQPQFNLRKVCNHRERRASKGFPESLKREVAVGRLDCQQNVSIWCVLG